MHHLNGASLAVGREGAVDVSLAQRFAEIAVGGADATPPARALLFGAGQGAGEEIEILIDDRFVQVRGRAVNHLPAHVGLPVVERMLGEQLFFGAEEIGRGDDVMVAGRSLHRFQISVPVDGGREFADLGQGHLVVDVLGVAALDVVHLRFGHVGFEFDYGAGVGCGLSLGFVG